MGPGMLETLALASQLMPAEPYESYFKPRKGRINQCAS